MAERRMKVGFILGRGMVLIGDVIGIFPSASVGNITESIDG